MSRIVIFRRPYDLTDLTTGMDSRDLPIFQMRRLFVFSYNFIQVFDVSPRFDENESLIFNIFVYQVCESLLKL